MMVKFKAYCVPCEANKEADDGQLDFAPSGRRIMIGTCPTCKGKITRILPLN